VLVDQHVKPAGSHSALSDADFHIVIVALLGTGAVRRYARTSMPTRAGIQRRASGRNVDHRAADHSCFRVCTSILIFAHLFLAGQCPRCYRTVLEHVEGALDREEAVRLLLLAQAVAEDGEVVVVVELLNVHLPLNLIADARVLDRDGKVSALVEPTEFCIGWVWPRNKGPALWNLEGFRSYNGFGK